MPEILRSLTVYGMRFADATPVGGWCSPLAAEQKSKTFDCMACRRQHTLSTGFQ